MSEKHENPYREGQYHDTFGFIKQKQVVTRAEVLAFTKDKFGVEKPADVTVLLSPRLTSKRGDCRGNISAQGHLYYMEKPSRIVANGVKGPQKFRLRWRVTPLEPRKRIVVNVEVKAEKAKAAVVEAKVEIPAENKAD